MKKSAGTDNTPSFNLLAPLITALSLTVFALFLGILFDTSPPLMSEDYARFSKHLGVSSMLLFIFSASLYVVNKMRGSLPAGILRFFRKSHLFTGLTAVITGIVHGNYFLNSPRIQNEDVYVGVASLICMISVAATGSLLQHKTINPESARRCHLIAVAVFLAVTLLHHNR